MAAPASRVTIARADWQRARRPRGLDLRPFLLFFRISDDEAGHRRQRQQDFEAQHYPHRLTLHLSGPLPGAGQYSVTPYWGRATPVAADLREANLRPWTLDPGARTLRGQLTASGQGELTRWLDAGLHELALSPAEPQAAL